MLCPVGCAAVASRGRHLCRDPLQTPGILLSFRPESLLDVRWLRAMLGYLWVGAAVAWVVSCGASPNGKDSLILVFRRGRTWLVRVRIRPGWSGVRTMHTDDVSGVYVQEARLLREALLGTV